MLRKLNLWARLDEADERCLLELPHEIVTVEKHRSIVSEGDSVAHCWLLISGFCVRYKIVGSGGRQIISIHMLGDLVDLQNSLLQIADHNVQALTTMTAAFIPRDAIMDLAFGCPAVGKALWLETLIEGSIAREWVANVGRRDSVTRVAHLLCEFAYRLDAVGIGKACNYELPMTQEQIADTVGLTSVHVNRTLKGLEAAGLITRSRRSVVIDDLARLAEVGDFRSTYLHLPREPLAA